MKSVRSHARGFTLIEVMIALVIFAVASSALIKNAALAVKQTASIEERTVAYWLAENELNQIRAIRIDTDTRPPRPGTRRQTIKMAGQEWELVTKISSTENEDVWRYDVSVHRDDKDESEVAVLTGFRGRY